ECHGAEKPKGKFRIDQLDAAFSTKAGEERWLAVREQVTTGVMPPKAKPRVPKGDVDALAAWIDGKVVSTGAARRGTQGRVVLRRLNRVEYENTIRDLLSVDIGLQDLLPSDTSDHGFDNVGEALHSSSFLMERYLEAADRALNAAISNGARPWNFKKR